MRNNAHIGLGSDFTSFFRIVVGTFSHVSVATLPTAALLWVLSDLVVKAQGTYLICNNSITQLITNLFIYRMKCSITWPTCWFQFMSWPML